MSEPRSDSDHVDTRVLALVRDLMFVSRITGGARQAGVAVKVVRDPSALTPDLPGRLVIADLNLPGALSAAAAWAQATGGRACGFVQHVDTQTIHEARAAGLDPVVPRSRFDAVLPDLLSR